MSYPINEDEFVEICMKELEEYDEMDMKVARAVAIALNWANHKKQTAQQNKDPGTLSQGCRESRLLMQQQQAA